MHGQCEQTRRKIRFKTWQIRETMEVKIITENKKQFLDLLLLADEQENMIDKYLPSGDLFALYDNDLKSVCVVVPIDSETCELKNIATYEKYQGRGYGRVLIKFISSFYKNDYKTMLVGTGEVPRILSFYGSCGFEESHRLKNFFTDNYDHPMFDGEIQLIDMVYLKKDLKVVEKGNNYKKPKDQKSELRTNRQE
jgi:GNAT superfamily N-acetyltransferase